MKRTVKRPEVRAMRITRRRYLLIKAMAAGGGPFLAAEAVASTAIEHPEWDMEEKRTFDEWERGRG
jgi:hypothetical protein